MYCFISDVLCRYLLLTWTGCTPVQKFLTFRKFSVVWICFVFIPLICCLLFFMNQNDWSCFRCSSIPMFTSHFQCLVPLQDMTFWSFFTVRRRASNATGRLLLVKDTVCYRRLAKSVTKVLAALEGSGWVWIHLDEIFCWMILTSIFLRYIDIIAGKCWAWGYMYIYIYM